MAALAALVFASHAERQGKVCLCNSSSFNTKPSFYAICPAQQPAHCASQRGARTPWTQSGRLGTAIVRHLTTARLLRTLRTLRALGCELQSQAVAAPRAWVLVSMCGSKQHALWSERSGSSRGSRAAHDVTSLTGQHEDLEPCALLWAAVSQQDEPVTCNVVLNNAQMISFTLILKFCCRQPAGTG